MSVLFDELIDSLDIRTDKQNIVVDCTLGLAGHTIGILGRLHDGDVLIAFDLDRDNLIQAKINILNRFEKDVYTLEGQNTFFSGRLQNTNTTFHLIHGSFAHLKETLALLDIREVTAICYDLGVSSAHFDDADRGFSFRFDGMLDMRFDRTIESRSARDVINGEKESELYRILRTYGEEPKAKFIAEAIVTERKTRTIETTGELATLISRASYDPKSVVRVFQALRIEVNREFEAIETSLRDAVELLDTWGRCSVITFHSLEDRLVKQTFAEYLDDERDEWTGRTTKPAVLKKVTKKPIIPTEQEIKENPRSRSAKLRIVEKL